MAEEQGDEKKPKFDIKKILTIAFAVINLGGLGTGAFLTYSATIGHHAPSASSDELNREIAAFEKTLQQQPMMYTMDQFNTNLTGVPKRLIRTEINLEMLDAEGFEEVIGLGAEGRDAIVRIINGKTYDDLESIQGKLHLKTEIIARLNELMDRGVVKDIYFSDFVVQ